MTDRPAYPEWLSLRAAEDNHIVEVLRRCNGNKSEAARMLRVDRRTLYRKLARINAAMAAVSNETEKSEDDTSKKD